MQRVAFLFREPGTNLKSGTICRRNVNYGKKDFLSPELRSKWNAFGDCSTEQNRGNSEARLWTEEEREDGDRCFDCLVAKTRNVIRANPIRGGNFHV